MGWVTTIARIKDRLVQNASSVVPCRSCVILCRRPSHQQGFTECTQDVQFERTGTATARAVESSDTMNTVMLRATKESQKESGFFDVSVPACSSDRGITGWFDGAAHFSC